MSTCNKTHTHYQIIMSKSLVRKGIVFVKGAAGEGRASKERYSTEKEKERLHGISERGRPQAGKVRRRRRRGKSGLVTKDEDNGANSQGELVWLTSYPLRNVMGTY